MAGDAVAQDSLLWGPLPTVVQVENIIRATTYSYEAGQYPDDMDEYTQRFVTGDGGLLNSLALLKRALALVGRREVVEGWHGKCGDTSAGWSNAHG